MKRIGYLTLGTWVGLLSGCATFDHQVGPSEAHGTLCFAVPNLDASAYRRPYRVDGSRLRPDGNTGYRVTPGRHKIVFEDVRIEVESYTTDAPRLGIGIGSARPVDAADLEYSPDTGLTASAGSPWPRMPGGSYPTGTVRSWAERRVVTMVTNTVEVKAGWEYRLDGWSVTGQPVRARSGPPAPGPATEPAADGAASGSAPPSARHEIFEAIGVGDLGAVRRLLDEDPSRANLRTGFSLSPLHYAAMDGRVEIVRELLRQGAEVDARDEVRGTPLMTAATQGHPNAVLALIEGGADVGARNRLGNRPLECAITGWRTGQDEDAADPAESADERATRYTACLEHLLSHGANPNAVSGVTGVTPLLSAVSVDAPFLIPVLVAHGAQPDGMDRSRSSTPLQLAALYGSEPSARALLECGASPSAGGRDQTPLDVAVAMGQTHIVDLLLARGASVQAPDRQGRTPLHFVMQADWSRPTVTSVLSPRITQSMNAMGIRAPRGEANWGQLVGQIPGLDTRPTDYPGTANRLITAGADVNQVDVGGRTPMMVAALQGNAEGLALLLEHGADMEFPDQAGFTPLLTAAEQGRMDLFTTLLEHGANVEARTSDGSSAAHLAAALGDEQMLGILLERGVAVDTEADQGGTLLLSAAIHGQPQIVDMLIESGASLDRCDRQRGWTPLMGAVEGAHHVLLMRRTQTSNQMIRRSGNLSDYVRVVKGLAKAGADVEATNPQGLTAVRLAKNYGLSDLVIAIESARE